MSQSDGGQGEGARGQRLSPLAEVSGDDQLLVHEIYASVQGESTHAGRPCTFVRLTACNLRCVWCDTPHAFVEGTVMTQAQVMARVGELALPLVEITGGEPLLQPGALTLMSRLCDAGHEVLLETSGALDIGPVDPRVARIMDLKAPGSGEESANRWENVSLLTPRDEVKIVLRDRGDYEWARSQISQRGLVGRCPVVLSPVFGALPPEDLAAWMVEDRLGARMQVQLHKVIWSPTARGV